MSNQPSTRKDLFGTEGVGQGGDSDMGKRGHSSQGGTADGHTGGKQGNAPRPQGTEANKQGAHEAPLDVNEPDR